MGPSMSIIGARPPNQGILRFKRSRAERGRADRKWPYVFDRRPPRRHAGRWAFAAGASAPASVEVPMQRSRSRSAQQMSRTGGTRGAWARRDDFAGNSPRSRPPQARRDGHGCSEGFQWCEAALPASPPARRPPDRLTAMIGRVVQVAEARGCRIVVGQRSLSAIGDARSRASGVIPWIAETIRSKHGRNEGMRLPWLIDNARTCGDVGPSPGRTGNL